MSEAVRIAVVGMGYVGLPLSLQFARAGVAVTGLDISAERVEQLNRGESFIKHIAAETIREQIDKNRFRASTDYACIREVSAVLICVPTPLSRHREPNLSFVLNTGRQIAAHLNRGTLVVLESTTYPGTTEEQLLPILEEGSGLKAGEDFHLAYSPEREDPGNPDSSVDRVPKLVGGLTAECLRITQALYGRVSGSVVAVSSCRVAEAAKLLENVFRSVNIALVNELKVVFTAMGIDIWEVIEAAGTKPFGFMPFYPGPGLGGHCIPIDPFYLTWKAREYGRHTRFIELAGEINASMPEYVVNRAAEALNEGKRSVGGSRILVIGLAYKPEVDDMRESPSFPIMTALSGMGAEVEYYDPFIPVIPPSREHMEWEGKHSIDWEESVIATFDLVIICTAHASIRFEELGEWCARIVDTRNAMSGFGSVSATVSKA